MIKSTNIFITFIVNILKLLFCSLFIGTILLSLKFFNGFDISTLILILLYLTIILIFYKLIKSDRISNRNKIGIIISIGLLLRILWILNINTLPYSDYETIFMAAKDLSQGNNYFFQGTNYIARFPHLSYMIVYLSLLIKCFGDSLTVIKIGNLIFSVITLYLIYKISLEVFNNNKLALSSLAIGSLFAPLITYTGVLATENIAIPFYLGSIYMLLLYVNDKISINKLILSGIILGIGNLFRMVGIIMLIAFVLYISIFTSKSVINKVKGSLFIITGFFIVLFIGSTLLRSLSITEVNLWSGREPNSTNILKGTNISSFGRFTDEDAALPAKYNYDYNAIDKAAKEIIKERLTTTPPLKLGIFYAGKFIGQWVQGDMSGVSWSESGANNIYLIISSKAKVIFQIVYSIIIILCISGLFNKKRIYKNNSHINLFYIILCGYGASYLLTEMQGRYAYIVCWVFIFLATSGLENIKDKIKFNKRTAI